MTQTPEPDYAALDFDGTERRANYRTIAYREDMLCLFERRDAAAILYQIIYRWQTEVRKPEILREIERRKKANLSPLTAEEVEERMWIWMSYNDFVRESGEAVAYNTVIRMLNYLLSLKVIEQRKNHDPRYPDYEYRINADIVKEKLKALSPAPKFVPKIPKKRGKKSDISTQMGTPETDSTQMGTHAQGLPKMVESSTQMGTEVYPNGGTSHITSHTSSQECTQSSLSRVTDAPTAVSPDDTQLDSTPYAPDLESRINRALPVVEQALTTASSPPQSARVAPKPPTSQLVLVLEKKPPTLEMQIADCFAALDEARRIAENNPNRTGYVRTKVAAKLLKDLILATQGTENACTPDNVKLAYAGLWSLPTDTNTGFTWKTRMWLPAILNNYEMGLEAGRKALVPAPAKPKSIDEQIADSDRAVKEFEAKERAFTARKLAEKEAAQCLT
jgi:hypothetical protein